MSISNYNHEVTAKDIAGLVIAGGVAKRLGQAKHSANIAGQQLLDIVVDRLAPQVGYIAVNLRDDMPYERCPVLLEGEADMGPLAGVAVGLEWAASIGAKFLVTMPVDVPFFPANFVASLLSHVTDERPRFAQTQRKHGLCAIWPMAVRDKFENAFHKHGVRAVHHMHDILGSQSVMFDDTACDQFMNINTPGDLTAANERAEKLK